MRRSVALLRTNRRRFLAQAAALAGLGLAAVPLRTARAADRDTVTVEIPDTVSPGERWVDVNLSQQVACALAGSAIVRVILVTTGQPGFETPEGQFRILYRVADERMTSTGLGIPTDSPDGYDLDHVLWTQYFTEFGHALHDNYWRPQAIFGHEATSHGCVGMVETDASYLWRFVGDGALVNIHGQPVGPR